MFVGLLRQIMVCLLSVSTMLVAGLVAAAEFQGVRIHQAPDYVRVVMDTSDAVKFRVFTLPNPNRVVIDIENTRAVAGFRAAQVDTAQSLITGVRTANRPKRGFRVVLDTKQKLSPNSFQLKPVDPYGHRLVLDLFGAKKVPNTPIARPARGLRPVLVAIDSGHGGEDPGAIGYGRIQEKRVVAKIAAELKKMLDAEPGFAAMLVRDGDYYVALEKRPQLARDQRADLFVSIHADAFRSSKVRGASVYTLSEKGASSETAKWLAERANHSDLIGGVGVVNLGDKDDLLASVLLDISMNANRSASIQAGESVLNALAGVTRLHKKRVEQAGFVVLKSPDIPSILIETGYISNPRDARNLANPGYQKKLARAIFQGLKRPLSVNPPPGTWLASQPRQSTNRYVIVRGDTLSGIAARHRVSTRRIRQANNLRNDKIIVGQVLLIPAG
ncbi:MAG: N-acetylmuramoyl-L-alanine amidase [Pseudomonadales bacterium]|nr:N-acetylmuramoyl-L-alanine amidase [Pseudomonadales bacterium]